MSKIAIIGLGTLGIATAHLFKRQELVLFDSAEEQILNFREREQTYLGKDHRALSFDNALLTSAVRDLKTADTWMICVPTPTHGTNYVLDTSAIEEYLNNASEGTHVIIRSTVPLDYCGEALRRFSDKLKISYFPEFLREATALDDVFFPKRVVWGGELPNQAILKTVAATVGVYSTEFLNTGLFWVSLKEAELIKLYSNAYLSLRLAFFGQLNKTCQKHDANFERVANALGRDGRIGSHYNKPPFKIGGKCLPKDLTNLAIQTADPLLQAVTHLISK